jgi:uncharacterized protein (DUF58 family)
MLAAEIIRRVKEIQVRTGRSVADVLAGEYVSVFRGAGIEFDEVRPYLPGDDVRSIDWNVTARAGSPYVKRYVEERQLTLMLMADVSASQDFGSGARSKREAAAELCAMLAFSAIRNDDKVGLVLFHGEVDHYIPPRSGQKHALRVVREVLAHGEDSETHDGDVAGTDSGPGSLLTRLRRRWPFGREGRPRPAEQGTDIARAMEFLLSVSKRRTVCFVVSDFLDEGFEHALSMANRRHDVVAVLITDPRELEMPAVGLIALRDAERGSARVYDTGTGEFREALANAASQRVTELEQRLRRRGIDFIHVDAAGSIVDPLVAFFRMRERRIRR